MDYSYNEGSSREATAIDDYREVDLAEEFFILPDSPADEVDENWVRVRDGNDVRLLSERPPHWE